MLYSIRMRASQGGPHEEGGRHISGAERILPESGAAGNGQGPRGKSSAPQQGQS